MPLQANSPFTTATSDIEASDSADVVARLDTGRSSPLAPPGKSLPPGDVEGLELGDDSTASSQSFASESSKGAFVDGRSIVGRSGIAFAFSRRTKVELLTFDKPISKLTQNRFDDLREQYAEGLIELTRTVPNCRDISMTLKVMGASDSVAVPWIFIQCDKTIAGKVRKFFEQSLVEPDFKPLRPDAYTPYFDIYVHELPPLPLPAGP